MKQWKIEYTESALESMFALGKQATKRIYHYMDERVADLDNPRDLGRSLKGPGRLWRYRVADDYRVICKIEDQHLLVLVVRVGHRKDVYRKAH